MVDQAEIHRFVHSEDEEERKRAAQELRISFDILNDKEQAWDDLIRLAQDNDIFVRIHAESALGACYTLNG